MLAHGLRVVTRAATAGYTAGRHRWPPATAPVVGGRPKRPDACRFY
jgi:hypothetical protein